MINLCYLYVLCSSVSWIVRIFLKFYRMICNTCLTNKIAPFVMFKNLFSRKTTKPYKKKHLTATRLFLEEFVCDTILFLLNKHWLWKLSARLDWRHYRGSFVPFAYPQPTCWDSINRASTWLTTKIRNGEFTNLRTLVRPTMHPKSNTNNIK